MDEQIVKDITLAGLLDTLRLTVGGRKISKAVFHFGGSILADDMPLTVNMQLTLGPRLAEKGRAGLPSFKYGCPAVEYKPIKRNDDEVEK